MIAPMITVAITIAITTAPFPFAYGRINKTKAAGRKYVSYLSGTSPVISQVDDRPIPRPAQNYLRGPMLPQSTVTSIYPLSWHIKSTSKSSQGFAVSQGLLQYDVHVLTPDFPRILRNARGPMCHGPMHQGGPSQIKWKSLPGFGPSYRWIYS